MFEADIWFIIFMQNRQKHTYTHTDIGVKKKRFSPYQAPISLKIKKKIEKMKKKQHKSFV